MFAWAYMVVICSGPEFLQVARVEAVGKGEAKDGRCDEAVLAVNRSTDGRGGVILVRGCASAMGGFV